MISFTVLMKCTEKCHSINKWEGLDLTFHHGSTGLVISRYI